MKSTKKVLDYGSSGKTICAAILDHAGRFPDRNTRPKYVLWHGTRIWTSDRIPVPREGIVRAEFLAADPRVRQGFDLELRDGWLELQDCSHLAHLRTWKAEPYVDVVEYPFFCQDGVLWTWNVYEMTYPGGQRVEQEWTGNAGFWVESISDTERVYHCSNGMASTPSFDGLVYKVSIRPR